LLDWLLAPEIPPPFVAFAAFGNNFPLGWTGVPFGSPTQLLGEPKSDEGGSTEVQSSGFNVQELSALNLQLSNHQTKPDHTQRSRFSIQRPLLKIGEISDLEFKIFQTSSET